MSWALPPPTNSPLLGKIRNPSSTGRVQTFAQLLGRSVRAGSVPGMMWAVRRSELAKGSAREMDGGHVSSGLMATQATCLLFPNPECMVLTGSCSLPCDAAVRKQLPKSIPEETNYSQKLSTKFHSLAAAFLASTTGIFSCLCVGLRKMHATVFVLQQCASQGAESLALCSLGTWLPLDQALTLDWALTLAVSTVIFKSDDTKGGSHQPSLISSQAASNAPAWGKLCRRTAACHNEVELNLIKRGSPLRVPTVGSL